MAKTGPLNVGPDTSATQIVEALKAGRVVVTDRIDSRWRLVRARLGGKVVDFSDKRRRFYHVTLREGRTQQG